MGDPPHVLAGLWSGTQLQETGLLGTSWSVLVGRVHVWSVDVHGLISTLLRDKGRKALDPEP